MAQTCFGTNEIVNNICKCENCPTGTIANKRDHTCDPGSGSSFGGFVACPNVNEYRNRNNICIACLNG